MAFGKGETGKNIIMKKYLGKGNVILSSKEAESLLGVIRKLNPSKEEIYLAGILMAKYTQEGHDSKKDFPIYFFKGRDISKPKGHESERWNAKNKKTLIIKKEDIEVNKLVDNIINKKGK